MNAFLLTLLLAAQPGAWITLMKEPCAEPTVLEWLRPESHQFYFAGKYVASSEPVLICWRVSPDGEDVWLVNDRGQVRILPMAVFRDESI